MHSWTLSMRGTWSTVSTEVHPCPPMWHQLSLFNLTTSYRLSVSDMLYPTSKVSSRRRASGSGAPGCHLMTLIMHDPLIQDLASALGNVCGSSCEGLGMITTAGVQGAAPLGYIRSDPQIHSTCRCMHVQKPSVTPRPRSHHDILSRTSNIHLKVLVTCSSASGGF